ncbi:MAG TPA: protein-methionine-sulfoxide reductase heme-binding subunit MsrQ [Polyangiaceae bacterium]|jgi:sulfoxide reductase heme-binding subunit YedZ|nr:protein-methionine-sulfoxide reductase heme-binding subunit MsrQ [Polyangiaceae bacterium]
MAEATARRGIGLDWLQPAVLTGSLVPFALIAWRAASGALGANPVATALNQLGLLALIFLVSSLMCTPLKLILGWTWPMRLRKTLGLLGFFTALTHFAVYLLIDQGGAVSRVLADVVKRPFIAVGFIALLLLVPVALTSRKDSPKKLGFKVWKRVHQLVYVTAFLAIVHFVLRVKADRSEPYAYGEILGLLFAVRLIDASRKWRAARAKHRA